MVVTPTSLTVYLNGKSATHNTSFSAVALNVMRIGSYQSWSDRNFDGEMDEVAIWKRALSKDEIRLMRHLTHDKIVGVDTDLMAYYQFNETTETVFDKSGNQHHATFSGNTTLVPSTAPVGGGTSQKIVIGGNGKHNFGNAGVQMTFPNAGTHPNGELVVSRIHYSPTDSLPNTNQHLGYYWIVNNYGGNQSFSALDHLKLSPRNGSIPQDFNNASNVTFFKRDDNEHKKEWLQLCNADSVVQGANNYFTFNTGCNLTGFSQLHLMANTSLPVELLFFDAKNIDHRGLGTGNQKVALTWKTATEIDFSHYEIERSADGRDFERINTVQSNTSLSYEIFDNQPLNGYNYYRLKIIDLDNSFEYSETKAVFIENKREQNSLKLFPNPVTTNSILNIDLGDINNARLRIYGASGKLAKDFILNESVSEIQLQGLSSGVYFYSIQTENTIWNGQLVVIE